ncbi:MAG: carbonic anhydrase [Candidatus Latescibacterota bacterium]|jgi:carbonic anhydrase
MISAKEAIERLKQGNRQFVSDETTGGIRAPQPKLSELEDEQHPFATIIGCSDSRVPVELIFTQGLGDLFVVRVAGNVVSTTQLGSVEFAVRAFGTALVVVLGHSNCGAVKATVDEIERPGEVPSPHLSAIIDRIRPSVERMMSVEPGYDRPSLVQRAVEENVRAATRLLRDSSAIIEDRLSRGQLAVVGATFSLKTGVVDFLDSP